MIHERSLLVVLLIVMNHCSRFQLLYNAEGEASSSHISLVMLGIQFSGYMLPLAAGFDDAESNGFIQAIFKNLIIPILFFLNITLAFIIICQVLPSRTKLNSAREIKVLVITLIIHALGLSIFLNHSAERLGILSIQLKQIEAYWGLVVDFFLLPQIIANTLWQIRSKPLREIYYIGFSLARAFPHLRNYFKDPAYTTTDEDQASPSLTSLNRFSDLAIAATVFFLAFVVYLQQRQPSSSRPEPAAESQKLD